MRKTLEIRWDSTLSRDRWKAARDPPDRRVETKMEIKVENKVEFHPIKVENKVEFGLRNKVENQRYG